MLRRHPVVPCLSRVGDERNVKIVDARAVAALREVWTMTCVFLLEGRSIIWAASIVRMRGGTGLDSNLELFSYYWYESSRFDP